MDPFTWCPSCKLAANHLITDQTAERPNPRAGEHVADIMVDSQADPTDVICEPDVLPGSVGRRCLFCSHAWREQTERSGA